MTDTIENDAPSECGWCGKDRTIVYTDVLGIDWCETCYADTFLENFTPDPTRVVTPPGE